MICGSERVRYAKNPVCVLVEFARELRTFIGQYFLRCTVFEYPMQCKSFGDVDTGCTLQADDFRELGESIRHEEYESVPSFRFRQRTQQIEATDSESFLAENKRLGRF